MSAGFVYVMVNPSLKVIKVGCSTKVPHFRAEELSQTTGVPTPYKVVYYAHFDDMFGAEKQAHYLLNKHHYEKEFFTCSPIDAINTIESMGGIRCHLSIALEYEFIYCPRCQIKNRFPKANITGLKCGSCGLSLRDDEEPIKPKKRKFMDWLHGVLP